MSNTKKTAPASEIPGDREFESNMDFESGMIAEQSALECILAVLDKLEDDLYTDAEVPQHYMALLGSAIHTMGGSLERIKSLMLRVPLREAPREVPADAAAEAEGSTMLN